MQYASVHALFGLAFSPLSILPAICASCYRRVVTGDTRTMATVFGNYFKQRVDGAGRSAATKAARSKKRRASKLATSGARVTQKSKQATVGAGSATSHPAGTAAVGGGNGGRPSSAKRRRKRAGQSSVGVGAGSPSQDHKPVRLAQKWDPVRASARHTFHTVASDHAETPAAAYADIAPFLEALAHARGVSKKKLRVYVRA